MPDQRVIDEQLIGNYCFCLLAICHDPFHARWGELDEDALAACDVEARSWSLGAAGARSGDSLHCRYQLCDDADQLGDPSLCDGALGGSPCVDP